MSSPSPSHRVHLELSVRAWTWAAIALSAAMCLAMTWMHYRQAGTIRSLRQLVADLREARVDLAKGFLHLTLSGDPQSPFRQETGIALIDQATAALQDAESAVRLADPPLNRSQLLASFEGRVAGFRSQLTAYCASDPPARHSLELPLRLSYHELDRMAQRVDTACRADLESLMARLSARFATTLGGAMALMGAMCLGVFVVGRRQETAVRALRASEERLRAANEFLSDLIEHSVAVLFVKDREGRYELVNRKWEEVSGTGRAQAIGKTDRALFPGPVGEQFWENDRKVLDSGRPLEVEETTRGQRGERTFLAVKFPMRASDGSIRGVCGIATEITERKRAEAAAQREHSLLRTLIDLLPDNIYVKDAAGRFLVSNRANAIALGKKAPDEVVGCCDADFFPPSVAAAFRAQEQRVLEGEALRDREEDTVFPDGRRVVGVSSKVPWLDAHGRVVGLVGIGRDITARKLAEEEIRRQAGLINSLLDSIPDLVFFKAPNGVYLGCNPAFAEFAGRPRDEIIGKTDHDLFRTEAADAFREHDGRMLESLEPRRIEEWVDYPNGRRVLLDTLKTPYWGPHKKLLGVLGISRDITERQRAEARLRESETRFRDLFENMSSGVAVYEAVADGRDFVLRDFNAAGEQIEQIPRDRVLGRPVTEVFPGAEAMGLLDVLRRVWLTGAGEHHPASEYADGRISGWRENSVYKLPSGEVVAVYDDVTERIRAQQALQAEAERLAAILDAQREIASANLDFSGLVQLVLERMSRMTGAEGACLEVAEGDDLVWSAAAGLAAPFVGLRLKIAASLSGRCLQSREWMRVDDCDQDPHADHAACRRIGLRSMFLLPLRYGENAIGVLKLLSPRLAAFASGVEPALRLMGEFLSATIARKQAEMSLCQQRNELQTRNVQLERFNRTTVGRELRMIELKEEINELCRAAGQPHRYAAQPPSEFTQVAPRNHEETPRAQTHEQLPCEGEAGSNDRETTRELAEKPVRQTEPLAEQRPGLVEAQAAMLNLVEDATVARDRAERANVALRASEEQFRAMFELASIGMAQADVRTGQWLRVNGKLCEITGYSTAEMLQMRVPQVTHPEDRSHDWDLFQDVIRGGAQSYRVEKRYRRKDGTVVWVSVNMTVIRDAAGEPLRTIATIEDITGRKRLEEEREITGRCWAC